MIIEKEIDLNEVKNLELLEFLKLEIEKEQSQKDLIEKVTRKIASINNAYFDNTLKSMLEEEYNYIVKPYSLKGVYEKLNDETLLLIRDAFVTVGGEASSGKTSLLTDLAINILKYNEDACFMFYTLDDSINISAKRILSQLNEKNLFCGGYEDYLFKMKYENILKRIILRDKINITTLEQEAEAAKRKTNCTKIVLAIDYLQAIPAPDTIYKDRRQLFNDYLKALKEKQIALQEKGGCILFCLSQLNRDAKSNAYRYRETSEIENQSDVCIDLVVPEDCRDVDTRFLIVQKNKLGKRGIIFQTAITEAFNFEMLYYVNDKNQYKNAKEENYGFEVWENERRGKNGYKKN